MRSPWGHGRSSHWLEGPSLVWDTVSKQSLAAVSYLITLQASYSSKAIVDRTSLPSRSENSQVSVGQAGGALRLFSQRRPPTLAVSLRLTAMLWL